MVAIFLLKDVILTFLSRLGLVHLHSTLGCSGSFSWEEAYKSISCSAFTSYLLNTTTALGQNTPRL